VRITHLWRYPVKSLAGEALTSTQLARGGIPFDRSFMLVDGLESRKGKPLTARQVPRMLAFQAHADSGKVTVTGPDGSVCGAGENLAAELASTFDRAISIQSVVPGSAPFFDAHELLVVNAASVRALASDMGAPVNVLRFRPNIVLDGDDAVAFTENDWVGRTFSLGDAKIEIVKHDIRCIFTNIDPETFEVDSSFLKSLVDRHDLCFGVYASVRAPGRVALGDEWREQT